MKTLRRENKSSETFTESGKKKASQTRCLTFAPYAWRRCIKMGIPSLKSAILYNVSLYFHSNHANITNIPDPIHENAPFCGQKAHFDVRVHENRHFHGQKKTAQSCLIKEEGAKLSQGFQINWNLVRQLNCFPDCLPGVITRVKFNYIFVKTIIPFYYCLYSYSSLYCRVILRHGKFDFPLISHLDVSI